MGAMEILIIASVVSFILNVVQHLIIYNINKDRAILKMRGERMNSDLNEAYQALRDNSKAFAERIKEVKATHDMMNSRAIRCCAMCKNAMDEVTKPPCNVCYFDNSKPNFKHNICNCDESQENPGHANGCPQGEEDEKEHNFYNLLAEFCTYTNNPSDEQHDKCCDIANIAVKKYTTWKKLLAKYKNPK